MARRRPTSALATTPPATLTRDQRTLLAEALRQAETTREIIEDKLVDFGRWLLVHVFDDDARAALEQKRTNPVWREIIDRAGGPTLRLSPRLVHVAIDIGAHDHRITDQSWRLLEPGRKELLLPLGEDALLQKAAKHVVALKLSHRATEQDT